MMSQGHPGVHAEKHVYICGSVFYSTNIILYFHYKLCKYLMNLFFLNYLRISDDKEIFWWLVIGWPCSQEGLGMRLYSALQQQQ